MAPSTAENRPKGLGPFAFLFPEWDHQLKVQYHWQHALTTPEGHQAIRDHLLNTISTAISSAHQAPPSTQDTLNLIDNLLSEGPHHLQIWDRLYRRPSASGWEMRHGNDTDGFFKYIHKIVIDMNHQDDPRFIGLSLSSGFPNILLPPEALVLELSYNETVEAGKHHVSSKPMLKAVLTPPAAEYLLSLLPQAQNT